VVSPATNRVGTAAPGCPGRAKLGEVFDGSTDS
jgi:hypothetical protein